MRQEIYIIEDVPNLIKDLKGMFHEEEEYRFKRVQAKDIDIALTSIPALFIIDEDKSNENIIEMCKKIRNNEDNSITPIIVVSSNTDKQHRIEVYEELVEYYIRKPVEHEYLYHTIKNLLRLIYTNRTVSPLTGLPGNVQIQAELKKRVKKKEKFCVFYFDLDNFKAYNDVYGFLKGDEIIKFTANIIVKNIHTDECTNSFVGHIGGDDFVAIVEKSDYEEICKNIIAEFDAGVLNYFTDLDIERGYLEVANRKSIIEQFPLTSISIGVVVIDQMRYNNILQIGEIGAQVKHVAKTTPGSSYAIDRRK